jgi:hypothetical protein
LRRALSELLGPDVVSLALTANRVQFLSARVVDGGLRVRLHRVFLDAPGPILQAVAKLCDVRLRGARRTEALAIAREYFGEHVADRSAPRPASGWQSRGSVHDLASLRDRLERAYFEGDLKVDITWSRSRRGNADLRRGGIHLRLGSYEAARRLVRIHPALDREEVPEHVVEAVVYHEMLHAAEPPSTDGARRRVHSASFRRRERQFPEYERAERWIAKNLRRLARWRNEDAGR